MHSPNIPILFITAIALFGAISAVAGDIGQELLDQYEPEKAGKIDHHDKKPGETDEKVGIQNYLFLGQDELIFDEGPVVDSGLFPASGLDLGLYPASGDDDEDPMKPGQKPVLPSYE